MQKFNITGLTRHEATSARLAGLRPETGWVRQVWLLPMLALVWGLLVLGTSVLGILNWGVGAGLAGTVGVVARQAWRWLQFRQVVQHVHTVVVLRDGLPRVLPVQRVVTGDVIMTQTGDRLPFAVVRDGVVSGAGSKVAGGLVVASDTVVSQAVVAANVWTQGVLVAVMAAIRSVRQLALTKGVMLSRWLVQQVRTAVQILGRFGWLVIQRLTGRMILFRRESAFRYNQASVQRSWLAV
ncbi:hypothetical protein [Lacticaseibacillus thailandensis]|nr:hypothetical protein [Lacticaseibacillus thailandensis]